MSDVHFFKLQVARKAPNHVGQVEGYMPSVLREWTTSDQGNRIKACGNICLSVAPHLSPRAMRIGVRYSSSLFALAVSVNRCSVKFKRSWGVSRSCRYWPFLVVPAKKNRLVLLFLSVEAFMVFTVRNLYIDIYTAKKVSFLNIFICSFICTCITEWLD